MFFDVRPGHELSVFLSMFVSILDVVMSCRCFDIFVGGFFDVFFEVRHGLWREAFLRRILLKLRPHR